MAETFEFSPEELSNAGINFEPTTFEFSPEELGEKPGKKKTPKAWEKTERGEPQMWSSHGEGARRAELVKKLKQEEESKTPLKRAAIRGTGVGLGGVAGATITGVPTLGGLAAPGGVAGMGIGYGLAEAANRFLYGEDPAKELQKLPPLIQPAQEGPVGGWKGAARSIVNAPRSINNLIGMPYEITKSITDPAVEGNWRGVGEATKEAGIGLLDFPFTASGGKDVYEKLTGQQPLDTYFRNLQLMGEEDPAGLYLGAKMAKRIPGAAWDITKATASKGLGIVTNPGMAKDLYRSAMKPTIKEGKSKEVSNAIERGLETEAVINRRGTGLDKVVRRVEAKEDIIQGILDPSTSRINVGKLDKSLDRIRESAADDIENVDMIRKTADKYVKKMRNHPKYDPVTDSIPVQTANTIKRRLYKNLRKGGAYDEGQVLAGRGTAAKGTARALMTAIEESVPELGPLNKELGKDLNLQKYLERATRRIENTDVLGMRTRLAMLMGVAAPKYAIISLAAAITDNPSFKSRLAIAIHRAHKGKLSLGESRRIVEEIPQRVQKKFSADEPFNPELVPPPEPSALGDYIPDRNVGKGLEEGAIPPRQHMDTSFNPETAGENINLGDAVPGRPGYMGQGLEEGGIPPRVAPPAPQGFNPEVPGMGSNEMAPGTKPGRIVPNAEAMGPKMPPNFNPETMAPAFSDLGERVATGREQSMETGVMPSGEGLRAPGERLEPASPMPQMQETVPGSKAKGLEDGQIPPDYTPVQEGYARQKMSELGFTPEQIEVALKAMRHGGVAAMIAALLPFTENDDNKALALLPLMGGLTYSSQSKFIKSLTEAKSKEYGFLRPALKVDGKIYTASANETHYDAALNNKKAIGKMPNAEGEGRGWVTPNDEFLDPIEAVKWLKKNDRDIARKLEWTSGGLESTDYWNAIGMWDTSGNGNFVPRSNKAPSALSQKLKNIVTDLTPEQIKKIRLWRLDHTPYSPKVTDFKPSEFSMYADGDPHASGKYWGENPQDAAVSSGWSTAEERSSYPIKGKKIKSSVEEYLDDVYRGDYELQKKEYDPDFTAGRPAKGSKIGELSEDKFKLLFEDGHTKSQITKELINMGYTHIRVPEVMQSGGLPEIIQLKPESTKVRGRSSLYSHPAALAGAAALASYLLGDEDTKDQMKGLGMAAGSIVGMRSAKSKQLGYKVDPFDAKLKAHVSDASSRINRKNLEDIQTRLRLGASFDRTTLGELVRDAEVFDHYPQLADVKVEMMKPGIPGNGHITVGSDGKPVIRVMGADRISAHKLRKLLGHEWQHWIQEHEGFASGGEAGVSTAQRMHYMRLGGEMEARGVAKHMDTPTQEDPLFWLRKNRPERRVGPSFWNIEGPYADWKTRLVPKANNPEGTSWFVQDNVTGAVYADGSKSAKVALNRAKKEVTRVYRRSTEAEAQHLADKIGGKIRYNPRTEGRINTE